MDPINEAVADQFARSLHMLREAILSCPDEEWCRGETRYQRIAGLALHIVETVDFYTSDIAASEYPWGQRSGADWEGAEDDEFPSRERVLGYLGEVEGHLQTWFASRDLLEGETVYPWTGPNVLGRAIYTLRNTQHHLADIAMELSRRGLTPPEWR